MVLAALLFAGCVGSAPASSQPRPVVTQPPTPPGPTVAAVTPTTSAPAASAPTPAAPPTEAPDTGTPPIPPGSRDLTQIALRLEPVITGLNQPVYVTGGNQPGRLYMVERVGRIFLYQMETGQIHLFLDIRDRVGSSSSEQGLLGLAFAPDFPADDRIYVNYTDQSGDTVVARFRAQPDQADPNSETLVLTLDQPARNHNGGMLLFGPDRMLWIGTGDGGRANDAFGNGQNPATLLGKMLRLDVLSVGAGEGYAIPGDNPWIAADWQGQDVRDEVWAVGLRNPWRYSFDRTTGDLWIGDVGQNQYEEIHFTPAAQVQTGGLNFGWPIMEGLHCFQASTCDATGLELPVVEYDHAGGNCSVTGGYVYRGAAYPVLAGLYLFGDFCSGRIWAYDPQNPDADAQLLLDTDMQISSFGEDAAGELYVVDLRGSIQRIHAEE
ncbi:MAG: glucose dehydrogenase [Caldilineae bacterium]|nr:MAG: glucose dehydrogenase [Caldilineae bacterium]